MESTQEKQVEAWLTHCLTQSSSLDVGVQLIMKAEDLGDFRFSVFWVSHLLK